MDKKKLPALKAEAEAIVASIQTDSTAPGNPTGIRLLAEVVIALIETLEKD